MKYTDTHSLLTYLNYKMDLDGVTKAELARRLNKTRGSVQGIFQHDNTTLETLNDMCKALNYDLEIEFVKKD